MEQQEITQNLKVMILQKCGCPLKTKLARKIQVPALKSSWLMSLSIYKVSKFGPEILWFTLKRLAVIQVLNTESRIVFSQDKKTPQFKQYKFLPERIYHDL